MSNFVFGLLLLTCSKIALGKLISQPLAEIKEAFFEQNLDHFDRQNRQTWEMRFLENDFYYEEGGPIYIWLSGHSIVSPVWINQGLYHDIAEESHGILFALEMRYFGASKPTQNISNDNLMFLTTDQTLADIAHFVDYMKSNRSNLANSRIFVAGHGYGGNLAIWFRQKYPHLVDGVWSSAGALKAKYDFFEYFEDIGNQISQRSVGCLTILRRAFRILSNLIDGGREEFGSELFNECEPLDASVDFEVGNFFQIAAVQISGGVLSGRESHIDALCEDLNLSNQTNELLIVAPWFRTEHRNQRCNNITFASRTEELLDDSWDSEIARTGLRQVFFQMCSEYGEFATSPSRQSTFGQTINIGFHVAICSRVFGEQFTEERIQDNVNRFNVKYGGVQPAVTNAIYSNSLRDPLRLLNVQKSYADSVLVANFPTGAFEMADLQSLEDSDDASIRILKETILESFRTWITNQLNQ